MLGPFTTTSRLTTIQQMWLAVLTRRLCIDVYDNANDDNA